MDKYKTLTTNVYVSAAVVVRSAVLAWGWLGQRDCHRGQTSKIMPPNDD